MGKLSRGSQILQIPLESLANILMILIMALVFVEVISRYIFGQSHGFMEEFSKWSQIWFTFLMIGVVEKGRRHIAVDILPRKIPQKYVPLLLIVLDIVILIFAIFLWQSGFEGVLVSKEMGTVSAAEIPLPTWIVLLCVPIGATFLAFFSVEHLAADVRSLAKRTGREE